MYKKWQITLGLILWAVVILVIAQLATGSLNPFEVFKEESVLLKIVMGIFLGMVGLSLIYLIFSRNLRNEICHATGCGKPLLEFAGAYGNPIRCSFCRRYFHRNCFKEGGGTITQGCKQPGCSTYQGDYL